MKGAWLLDERRGRAKGGAKALRLGRLQLRAVQELCKGNYDDIKVSLHDGTSELSNSQRWKII